MITPSKIRTAVQDEFKINIKSKCRQTNYVVARTIYFKLCKDFTGKSYDFIGSTLKKNHATVLHAVKNIYSCWEFCKTTSQDDQKNINIFNKIKNRLEKDFNIQKKIKPITPNHRAMAAYWKNKYYKIKFYKRYDKAVINYAKRYKQESDNC